MRGIVLFGALWLVPAVGFLAAGVAMLAGWEWWRPWLLGTTVLSLALTGLDWSNAFMAALVNAVILAVAGLGPYVFNGLR